MRKSLRFDEILKFQQGGAVQQALPINFHVETPENPYTDISDLLQKDNGNIAAALEVDTTLIDKADGLMGEKAALHNKIITLQQEIQQSATSNSLWLQTKAGIGKIQELRTLATVGANNLNESKKMYEESRKRINTNNSETHFIQDLASGQFIVRNNETGNMERVSPFEAIKNKEKYTVIRNNDALSFLQSAKNDPSDFRNSIDIKNTMGLTKGKDLVMQEVNIALGKAGSMSSSTDKSGLQSIEQLMRDPEVMALVSAGNLTQASIAKVSLKESSKTNMKHLEAIVNNLMSDPNRLSDASKRGMENEIINQMMMEGNVPDSPEAMRKEIKSRMGATLMAMALEQSVQDIDNSMSASIEDPIDRESIPLGLRVGPQPIQMGDWNNVHAYPLDVESFSIPNGSIPFGKKHQMRNVIDVKGVLVGNGTADNKVMSEIEAQQILDNIHATTGHVIFIPVYMDDGRKGTPAVDALGEHRKEYDQVQNTGLEKIQELKKNKSSREAITAAGEEMKKNLSAIVDKAGIKGQLEFRAALVLHGTVEGESHWIKNKIGDKLKKLGSVRDESLTASKRTTGSKDAEVWTTTIIAPLQSGITLDQVVEGDFMEKQRNKRGGRITIMSVGGKLMSFKDIK